MNPHRHSEADEQASLWAARLEGSPLSAADRAELDRWLAAAPAHRSLLSQYCQFSADLELALPALVEAGLVKMPPAPESERRSRRLPFFLGTALAAAAAVALTLWVAFPRSEVQQFSTPAGQHQTVALADGTQVDLTPRTQLQVTFTRGERHVQLSDGEAFFVVAKNPSRPFIVDTPAGSVRVTGTEFNVRSDGAPHFDVIVAEGSVQARPGTAAAGQTEAVALGAGDHLTAEDGRLAVRPLTPSALADLLSWRTGQVVFERVPLRDAVARFARYHHREIVVADSVAQLTVGGRYSLDDLDGFFAALEAIHPIKVIRPANGPIQIILRDQT